MFSELLDLEDFINFPWGENSVSLSEVHSAQPHILEIHR